jgi:hypothetical protein
MKFYSVNILIQKMSFWLIHQVIQVSLFINAYGKRKLKLSNINKLFSVVHSSDATNSIKVYDGKLDNPRMYKVVHASRTTKASQVLVRILRQPLIILVQYKTIVTPRTVNILKSVYSTFLLDFSHQEC